MVLTRHEYMPYGEDWITEGDEKNTPKYNSQELDKESGYYFYNAKHYDPEIGRFVTADTVIDGEYSTQGWNRFAYVHNNPIRYKYPTGHNMYDALNSPATKVERAESSSGYLSGLGSGLVSAITAPLNMVKDAAVWGYNKVTGSNARVGDNPHHHG
jgi:RHS repeat-associated protein